LIEDDPLDDSNEWDLPPAISRRTALDGTPTDFGSETPHSAPFPRAQPDF
jgi:hypothetical protein